MSSWPHWDPRTDEDEKMVAAAQKRALSIAGARRGAAHITPFRVGDLVRVINPYYLKQKGMRSNLLKQRPRWSITRYKIKRVEGDVGDMPRYDLEDDADTMYTHDMLALANVSEPVPADITTTVPTTSIRYCALVIATRRALR